MAVTFEPGFSPEFEKAKAGLLELRAEYAALLSEYDEMTGTVRANLESEYMMRIGRKEHQLFTLRIRIMEIRREIALYQAAKNRGEVLSREEVRVVIEKEFAEYRKQLAEQREKVRLAEELHFGKKLSAADSKAIKTLYHDLVKMLHPDVNPELPPEAKNLWLKIAAAYRDWDWQELNVLADMAYDLLDRRKIKLRDPGTMEAILEQTAKLSEKIAEIRKKMNEMALRPPFCHEKLLSDPEAVRARRGELDELLEQAERHLDELETMRNELLGDGHAR